jgi:hypothetical protein
VRGDDFVGQRPARGRARRRRGELPRTCSPDKKARREALRGALPRALRQDRDALPGQAGRAAALRSTSLRRLRGHVSPETMDEVGDLLGLPPAYVRGVATFYTMYNKRPGRALPGPGLHQHLVQPVRRGRGDGCVPALRQHRAGRDVGGRDFTVIEAECLAGVRLPHVRADQLALLRERDARRRAGHLRAAAQGRQVAWPIPTSRARDPRPLDALRGSARRARSRAQAERPLPGAQEGARMSPDRSSTS